MKLIRFVLLLIAAAVFSFGSLLMVTYVESVLQKTIMTAMILSVGVGSIGYACMVINDGIGYGIDLLKPVTSYISNAMIVTAIFAVALALMSALFGVGGFPVFAPYIIGFLAFAIVTYRD
jgi:hypothetical protein